MSETTTVVRSTPNFWGRLGPRSRQKTIDACDRRLDRWEMSADGRLFLTWDRRVVDVANEHDISYRAAMEVLRVEFV